MNEKLSDCTNILNRIAEKRIGKNVADAPKISVIIPAYNIAPYIKETLDSVFAQTYQNYEVIVLNDGAKDTEELETALEPYFEKIVYGKQENLGAARARNSAICLSRGAILAFLDGDDVWLPDFLGSQIDFLEKNDFEMVYCDAELFGESFFEGKTFMQSAPSNGAVTPESLINTECNVITSGTMLKKSLLEKSDMFDAELWRMQDFDLWFRLSKNGARIGYQKKVLLKYRVRPHSISGTNVDRSERNVMALDVIKNKYKLTEREEKIWKEQMDLCKAELELEKGKLCLIKKDYPNARLHFVKANEFYRKPKLYLTNWLLRLSPSLTLQLFKKIRPAEFAFISPNES